MDKKQLQSSDLQNTRGIAKFVKQTYQMVDVK